MGTRYSSATPTQIKYEFWLVFDDNGGMRFSRSEPDITRGEQKIRMLASLPKTLWQRPQLHGAITIEDGGIPVAAIDVKATNEAVRSVTGLDIDIRATSE